MKILFVCKHNRFRSKVAEAIFRKLNKNKKIMVDSAGVVMDKKHNYVEPVVKKIMREKGYNVEGKPKLINFNLINDFDFIIIVADNVSRDLFKGFNGKILWWKIPDCDASETTKIRKIIDEIEKRVEELLEN